MQGCIISFCYTNELNICNCFNTQNYQQYIPQIYSFSIPLINLDLMVDWSQVPVWFKSHNTYCAPNPWYKYFVDEKLVMISLFNNSEKLVQILLEFSQQIVEGYNLFGKVSLKKILSVKKICDLSQNKGWTLWPYFTFAYKMW